MRTIYKMTLEASKRLGAVALGICVQWGLADVALAQQGGQGNTTIFGGAQMTFFGNYNFNTGGGGAQPGVILTERASGNFGILNFAPSATTATNASDAGYVDGYVRKYGSGQFIFPVGDNTHLGQFAASADGTMGAYFFADPGTATTSNLFTGGNYTALPSGGPFATSSFEAKLNAVSTVEYWDIDGANATPLTLTWDAASAIGSLTGNELNKLTIAGWNGSQWIAIPSKVDTTSILGGNSDLTAGSITTTAALAPDTYTAYTFATLIAPLPVTLVRFNAAKEGQTSRLHWATTEETNSDRFEIERSGNGKQWSKIGSVASNGESRITREYYFMDTTPLRGQNLYRLRMVDKDETFAYSGIRNVTFAELATVSPYPNPVSDRFHIKDFQQIKQVVLHNASGTKVFGSQRMTSEGIDVTRLQPGLYTLTIALFDGTISTHKVAVTR
ncbi:T9SS type A sorting domain-containing protein [Dyadobacter sp. 676]|uniref:T9SS type A sorting domain-containing protein n=1 Tax=Dyadobacter sp. 676 TaxID=3088362 RepID=A0AAU8FFL5_9BACT